ncbi:MAG: phosphatidylglycerophosphatase A [marine bacterium B5-7]|nr:MAG: phosphatidylglycerophosphatase A [marine bacterium B5-7]
MSEKPIFLDSTAKRLALVFGAGCAPVMPGTVGTLAAIPLYLLMTGVGPVAYLIITMMVIVIGVLASGRAARELNVHDHPAIVIDEVAGYLVTMALVPFSWTALVLGFIAFRFFDIVKPWPISWFDRKVPGGAGIMLDDIIAGLFANLVLWLILTFGSI